MCPSIAIEKIRKRLRTYVPNDPAYPDDEIAIACIEEAADPVNEGNFGIGCTLLDAEKKIVARLYPAYRDLRQISRPVPRYCERRRYPPLPARTGRTPNEYSRSH